MNYAGIVSPQGGLGKSLERPVNELKPLTPCTAKH